MRFLKSFLFVSGTDWSWPEMEMRKVILALMFFFLLVSAFNQNCFLCWDRWNGTSLHLTWPCSWAGSDLGCLYVWTIDIAPRGIQSTRRRNEDATTAGFSNLYSGIYTSAPYSYSQSMNCLLLSLLDLQHLLRSCIHFLYSLAVIVILYDPTIKYL